MSLRSRLLAVLLFLVVPVALAPVGAMAQQPAPAPSAGATAASATVHGMVVDPDDALIPGATVTLTPASGKAQSTTSKSDGTYSFRGLAAGTYSVTVSATGFANFTKQAVRVTAGANLNVDVTMALAEQMQQVNVIHGHGLAERGPGEQRQLDGDHGSGAGRAVGRSGRSAEPS